MLGALHAEPLCQPECEQAGEWVEFKDGALGDGLGSEIGVVRQIYVLANLQSFGDLRQGMSSRGAAG